MNGNLNVSKVKRFLKNKNTVTALCAILIVVVLIVGYTIRVNNATKPVKILILKAYGICNKVRKFEKRTKRWLDCSIDMIIEKRTTKPPIIKTVLIELIMLFDRISPKLEKESTLSA